jgi:DNA primase
MPEQLILTVEEIKSQVEIRNLVAWLLNEAGSPPMDEKHMCQCLVHEDNDPSMIVNTETAYCFACEQTWDVIGLVRDHYQIGFPETLLWFQDHIDELVEYVEVTNQEVTPRPKVNTWDLLALIWWVTGTLYWTHRSGNIFTTVFLQTRLLISTR